jgi:hypothetical protein
MANPYTQSIAGPTLTEQSVVNTNPDILGLERQKLMAQMLLAKAQEGQPAGQMISGHYVAPAWTQRLAPVANQLLGEQKLKDVEEQQLALAEALRKQEAEDLNKFYELQYGGKQVPGEAQAGPMPNGGNIPIQTIASAPNPQAAFEMALKSRSPVLIAQLAEMLKEKKVSEGEKITRYNPVTGKNEVIAEGAEKFQRPIEVNTGNGTQLLDARTLKPIGFVPKVKGEGEVNPQEAPLRTQFLGQIQPHIQISQAYGKIISAPDTAAGDMSKIFGFMKILDPGSTVREGEYASAEQTRGIPEAVVAQYNKAVSGKRLTTEQREKFDQAAGDLVTSQKKQFDQQKQFFTNIATNARANPANVIFDPYQGLDIKTTPPKATPPTVNQQLNIPSANLFNAADAIISGKK